MSIPSPYDYKDWREWASAVARVISDSTGGVDPASLSARGESIPPVLLPEVPDGYRSVWLSDDETALFMGNSAYDPPTGPDLFQIDTAKLADAAVATNKVQASAITNSKLLDAVVDTLKLAAAAVTNAKVATDAINTLNLIANAITGPKISDLAVSTAKLALLAVTAAQLADAAVSNPKLLDNAVTTVKITDANITQAKIGLLAVGAAQIIDLAVSTAKIGLLAVGSAQIALLAVGSAQIADAAIVTAKIGTAAVLTANIGTANITSALIADANILSAKILDAAVVTAKIANAAIVSALIGDAQVVSAKIADLAVNTAHLANAAITSAKIANLSVGAAHIIDASITDAKIAGTITSSSWNSSTKAGWSIDKAGNIQGQGIAIYDNTGTLIFGSGGTLAFSRVTGAGALAALSSLSLGGAYLTGFGGFAAISQLTTASEIADSLITSAKIVDGTLTASDLATGAVAYGSSVTSGFGTFAAISLLNSGNISTYIAGAAIGSALIANAAIGTALINTAAITTALIADGAIVNAKIADATIASAKIGSLVVDKITAGTLDAVIDVGTGLLKFTVGGSALYLGKGFGTSSQFFLWFGPSSVAVADADELSALIYFKTDGSAYFGGSLSSGTITNAGRTTLGTETEFVLGSFTSVGHSVSIITQTDISGTLAQDSTHTWTELNGDTSNQLADPYASIHHTIRVTFVLAKSSDGTSYTTLQTYSQDVVSTSRKHLVSRVVSGGNVTDTKYWEHVWSSSMGNTTTDTLGSGSRWLRMQRTVLTDLDTSATPTGTVDLSTISIRSVEV